MYQLSLYWPPTVQTRAGGTNSKRRGTVMKKSAGATEALAEVVCMQVVN